MLQRGRASDAIADAPGAEAAVRCRCAPRPWRVRAAPARAFVPQRDLISGRLSGPPGGSKNRVGGNVARSINKY